MTQPTLPPDHDLRMSRARLALDGLSVGDALGETCFDPDHRDALLEDVHATARGPWLYTDDTEMALAVHEVLDRSGAIDQDDLAATFARRFHGNPLRGYGAGAFKLLGRILAGEDWRLAAELLFSGGSFGNGSAMRIAPLAGYFAEDEPEVLARQATLASAVTHAHPEGIAGGVAAALAGAYAWRTRERRGEEAVKRGLFDAVLAFTPPGAVRKGVEHARSIPLDMSITPVARLLGNGTAITCQDTVPFCLWVAARHLDDYPAAIRAAVVAGGDVDTTCAIVGGIVALAVGEGGVPAFWRNDREPLQLRS